MNSSDGCILVGDHRLPLRPVVCNDRVVTIPRYVYRDREHWIVELNRKDEPHYREFFGDNRYGGDMGSLEVALESLYEVLPNYLPNDRLRPGSSLYYMVREQTFKHCNVKVLSIQTYICSYRYKLRTIAFYAGTENTVDRGRMDRAIDRAIGTRLWSIDMIKREGRDVLFSSEVPKNIENYGC